MQQIYARPTQRIGPLWTLRCSRSLALRSGIALTCLLAGPSHCINLEAIAAERPPAALSYQAGQAEAEVTLHPLLRHLLKRSLRQTLPSMLELKATDLTGELPFPEIANASSTSVDASGVMAWLTPQIEAALRAGGDRYGLPSDLTVAQLHQVFRYQLKGSMTLSPVVLPQPQRSLSQATATDAVFDFVYDSQTQQLQLEDLDASLVSRCRWQICGGAIASQIDVDLRAKALLDVSKMLGFSLPNGVERLLRLAPRPFSALDAADGSLSGTLEIRPLRSPEASKRHRSKRRALASTKTAPAMNLQLTPNPNPISKPILRRGHFALHVRGESLPWSLLFSLP